MTNYRHTQAGWAVIIPMLLLFAVGWGMGVFSTKSPWVTPFIAAVTVVALSLFCTLNVTIAAGWLQCRFGVGLIWRRIRLSDVQRAEAVRNKWYYGWGIRLTPQGWLWNVAGLDAVELTFIDGKKFRIGTDEPEKLVEAIRACATPVGRS